MNKKYEKLVGKNIDTEGVEEKVVKTPKSGLVERQRKIMIVEENGVKKQLLREQI